LRDALGVPMPAHRRQGHEAAVESARGRLGETQFGEAWAAGHAMTTEEAVTYALSSADASQTTEKIAAANADEGGPSRLSPREREVAALIGRGRTSREIAAELIVSEKTVDAHADHIRQKLGLRSRAEIAVWAVRHGLSG
jgi:DNA-binding NarL/FixJ family response regulator